MRARKRFRSMVGRRTVCAVALGFMAARPSSVWNAPCPLSARRCSMIATTVSTGTPHVPVLAGASEDIDLAVDFDAGGSRKQSRVCVPAVEFRQTPGAYLYKGELANFGPDEIDVNVA